MVGWSKESVRNDGCCKSWRSSQSPSATNTTIHRMFREGSPSSDARSVATLVGPHDEATATDAGTRTAAVMGQEYRAKSPTIAANASDPASMSELRMVAGSKREDVTWGTAPFDPRAASCYRTTPTPPRKSAWTELSASSSKKAASKRIGTTGSRRPWSTRRVVVSRPGEAPPKKLTRRSSPATGRSRR